MIPMTARPEPAPSLREHALRNIRNAITNGDLAEDRIYSAAGLAKQLGVSLSPVREAMMGLVTEGTVEAVPNRGFRLVPITRADLEEIIHIRTLLAGPAVENLATRRAAVAVGVAPDADSGPGHGTDDGSEFGGVAARLGEQLAQLRTWAAEAVTAAEAGDRAGFLDADRSFHEDLLEYGLGRRAAAISLRLRDQSRLVITGPVDFDVESAQQLVELVDLIEAGKPADARALVVENLYYFKRADSKTADEV